MQKKGEHIHKRKDGRWESRYRSGTDKNGRAVYRSVYGKSCGEVRKKLSQFIESSIEAAPLTATPRRTVR